MTHRAVCLAGLIGACGSIASADIASLQIVSIASGVYEGATVTLEVRMDLDQSPISPLEAIFFTNETTATIDFDGDASTTDDIVVLTESGTTMYEVIVFPDAFTQFRIQAPSIFGDPWESSSNPDFGLSGKNFIDIPITTDPLDADTLGLMDGPLASLELMATVPTDEVVGTFYLNDQFNTLRVVSRSLTVVPNSTTASTLAIAALMTTRRRR